jgi:hypothetical protein
MKAIKVILTIGALGLVTLAGASAGFWWGVEQKYPYQQIKRWQKSKSDALPARAMLHQSFARKSDIVMVGDSLTAGVDWQDLFPQVVVANRGIGGETTADILRRIPSIKAVEAKRSFVMAGINDIGEGVPVDAIFNNYVQIIEQLRDAGSEVVVQSTVECARSTCGAARIEAVRDLNRRLRDYAKSMGLGWLDVNDGIVGDAGLQPGFSTDGIHLNVNGYRHWRDKLAPLL